MNLYYNDYNLLYPVMLPFKMSFFKSFRLVTLYNTKILQWVRFEHSFLFQGSCIMVDYIDFDVSLRMHRNRFQIHIQQVYLNILPSGLHLAGWLYNCQVNPGPQTMPFPISLHHLLTLEQPESLYSVFSWWFCNCFL